MIRTEALSQTTSANNAIEFEDYLPKHEKITFLHGENVRQISIQLVKEKVNEIETKMGGGDGKVADEEEESEEALDVMFKIKLEKPEPLGVKISKKNVCIVTIVQGDENQNEENTNKKLLEYYLSQKDVTWGQQFKNAIMLGPQIDQDNFILEDVSGFEAFSHFISIGWKVLFSLVPPARYASGKPAFFISLAFIAIVTAVVGTFAELLGCQLGIDDSITAITLVALGTSLPDTFASMSAARSSEYADAAIGNITGSNSVNVFLGLGFPWVIAAIYFDSNQERLGRPYYVPAGEVAYSVYVFLICALLCFAILIARRIVSTLIIIILLFRSSVESLEAQNFRGTSVFGSLLCYGAFTLLCQFLTQVKQYQTKNEKNDK